jgi:hypothetical protein
VTTFPFVSGRVVDLLPLVNLERDAIRGTWKQTRDGIELEHNWFNQTRIAYQPPPEYEFRTEIGHRYTAIVHVRKTMLYASIDGKLVAEIPVSQSAAYGTKEIGAIVEDRCLGLASCMTNTPIHTIEIAEITGEGKPIRRQENPGPSHSP